MGVQLSLKAVLPLAERIATASNHCSKTGLSISIYHWNVFQRNMYWRCTMCYELVVVHSHLLWVIYCTLCYYINNAMFNNNEEEIKWMTICRWPFWGLFLTDNTFWFQFHLNDLNWLHIIVGSGNGLVPHRQQNSTWTNVGYVPRYHMTLLVLNELNFVPPVQLIKHTFLSHLFCSYI